MDFYQRGPTTLHDLRPGRRGHARRIVAEAAASRRSALVLPMLSSEMATAAPKSIRDALQGATFLHRLVVPLGADDAEEVERVRRFFAPLPFRVSVVWCESPQVRSVLDDLAHKGLDLAEAGGKGLAVWLGMGIAAEECDALAVHDADIEDYDPRILHRLLLPVVAPGLDFAFAKGYYARLTGEQMYGRVVRLFVWPLIDALQTVLPSPSPLLSYLRAFRYPLSGEMAFSSSLAKSVRMMTDWGLEVGLLGEVYRNASAKRICQVDLGVYSHKHKPLGASASQGLQKMATDIAATLFRLLASMEGFVLHDALLPTLRAAYQREAQEAIRKYHADAYLNGLAYDRHGEEVAVERFETVLEGGAGGFLRSPCRSAISEWMRVLSADADAARALAATARPLTGREADALRSAALDAAVEG